MNPNLTAGQRWVLALSRPAPATTQQPTLPQPLQIRR